MTEATYQEKVEAGIAKATEATPTSVKDEADRILRHVLTTNRKAHSGMFWAYVNDTSRSCMRCSGAGHTW
jgi:hypothetical protein